MAKQQMLYVKRYTNFSGGIALPATHFACTEHKTTLCTFHRILSRATYYYLLL